MVISPFRALYPKPELVASYVSFISTVKYNFQEYCRNGFYRKTKSPHHYTYQIEGESRTYSGVLTSISIADFKDNILKHEDTIASKEQITMDLLLHRMAMIKPILVTHPSDNKMSDFVRQHTNGSPLFELSIPEYGETHRFWQVENGDASRTLEALFRDNLERLYIADGHHRTAAFTRLRNSKHVKGLNLDLEFLFSAVFSFDQLEILDYNRVVEVLFERSLTNFMAKISQFFNVECLKSPQKPNKPYELTMYLNREWFRLTWRDRILDKYTADEHIDSHLFNEEFLRPLLNVEDVRSDERVKYVSGREGTEGVMLKTNKEADRVGFCLFPPSKDKFRQVADSGEVLPPKSTWFEPRLRNGLFAQEFRSDDS
jgi:uncharacterized protein (DUF1015 family)